MILRNLSSLKFLHKGIQIWVTDARGGYQSSRSPNTFLGWHVQSTASTRIGCITSQTVVSIATTLCQHRESFPSRNMSSAEVGYRLATLPTVSPLLCTWFTCRWLVLLVPLDFFFFRSLCRCWPYLTQADTAISRARTPKAPAPMKTYSRGTPNW